MTNKLKLAAAALLVVAGVIAGAQTVSAYAASGLVFANETRFWNDTGVTGTGTPYLQGELRHSSTRTRLFTYRSLGSGSHLALRGYACNDSTGGYGENTFSSSGVKFDDTCFFNGGLDVAEGAIDDN